MIAWKNKHKTLLYMYVHSFYWPVDGTALLFSPNTLFVFKEQIYYIGKILCNSFLPVPQARTMRQVFFTCATRRQLLLWMRLAQGTNSTQHYVADLLCSDDILVFYFVIRWRRCMYLISNSVEIYFTHLSIFTLNYDFRISKLKIVVRWLQ